MKQFGFPKSNRLLKVDEFEAVYRQRVAAGDGNLLVFAIKNEQNRTRCGVSVSKKHGNAVRRAQLKRLLREAIRLSFPQLPGECDFVLIPCQNVEAGLSDIRKSLVRLAKKLQHRLSQECPS